MKPIRKLIACACALAFALVIAGCSSGGSAASSSAAADSATSASAAASAASSAAASDSASAAASDSASDSASANAASSAASAAASSSAAALPNGTYNAVFDTDSSMFHVNEMSDGRGVLTVADDGMTIHVTLVSKKIVNLYAGTADQAKEDAAGVIEPTTDKVTYSDGIEEEVYGFDIPVPALDEEFDVAILGEKGTWYDHKVSVSDPIAE